MKNKIVVKQFDEIIFNGNILDIPIKENYIIKKSIEIFDDDDPCIIHKSFVVKQVVDDLLKQINRKFNCEIKLIDFKDKLYYLDLDLDNTTLFIEG